MLNISSAVSGALPGKMLLLLKIIKIMLIIGQVRLSKGQHCPAGARNRKKHPQIKKKTFYREVHRIQNNQLHLLQTNLKQVRLSTVAELKLYKQNNSYFQRKTNYVNRQNEIQLCSALIKVILNNRKSQKCLLEPD